MQTRVKPPIERTPLKRILRLTGTAIALASLLLAWAIAPVQAVAPGWRLAAGLGSANLFVGQQVNDDGVIAYCSDYELLGPGYSGGYRESAPGGFVRSDGTALSEQQNAALSYLLLRWGSTQDNETAAAVQLSVWALSSPGRDWDSAGMREIIGKAELPDSAVALGQSLTEQSLAYAGPYRIGLDLPSANEARASLLTSAGTQVPGLGMQARTSGSLQFADSSSEATWTTGTSPEVLSLQRLAFGTGTLTAEIAAAPIAAINWLIPSDSKAQRLITTAVTTKLEAIARLDAAQAFQPLVSTQTSESRITAPGLLYDNLAVSTADGVEWLTDPQSGDPVQLEVVSTLWGPFPARPSESVKIPDGAPEAGSVRSLVAGPGEYRTAPLPVSAPGYYVWTERIDPSSAVPETAKNFIKPWQSVFGKVSETSLLTWTPALSTELSSHEVVSGSTVTDRVSVSGLPPAAVRNPFPLTLKMYGPMPQTPVQSANIPSDSALFQTRIVQAADGATAEFGPLIEPGCYTVVASFEASEELTAWQSDFGEPSETVCVQAPPAVIVPAAVAEELAATGPATAQTVFASAAVLLVAGLLCSMLARGRKARGSGELNQRFSPQA